jgi:hypothetical protein
LMAGETHPFSPPKRVKILFQQKYYTIWMEIHR